MLAVTMAGECVARERRTHGGADRQAAAVVAPANGVAFDGLRVAMIGPLPPPAGGMAAQTMQLAELLTAEGACVVTVQTNRRVAGFVGRLRGVRAPFRLVAFCVRVWRAVGRSDIAHVMANSGWSWHLAAAPAIWIARLRGVPAIVNYRGGEAAAFLARSAPVVRATLRRASALVVPSGFLEAIFAQHGMRATIVPNIVDRERFRPAAEPSSARCILVARNLEPIYDVATALRAFARVHAHLPDVRMTVAGDGPSRAVLVALRDELGMRDAVDFCGSLDRQSIADRYRGATIALNPSRVDNMPNSVLEAMACRVPVVSTDVGGVPYILEHEVTGLLVPPGDVDAMAQALVRLLRDPQLADRLAAAAHSEVERYTWRNVRDRWAGVYRNALGRTGETA